MKGYIVTQKGGTKKFFRSKPTRNYWDGWRSGRNGCGLSVWLDRRLFELPEAVVNQKPSDEPIEVEITITPLQLCPTITDQR